MRVKMFVLCARDVETLFTSVRFQTSPNASTPSQFDTRLSFCYHSTTAATAIGCAPTISEEDVQKSSHTDED